MVPASAIAPVPHPALAAEARRRHQLHQQQAQYYQKQNHLAPPQHGATRCPAAAYTLQLRAAAAGLPTARSAAAAALHATCLGTLCRAVAAAASVAAAADTAVHAASPTHLSAQHGQVQGATGHEARSRFRGQDADEQARQGSTEVAVAAAALTGVLAKQPWGLERPLAHAVALWAVAACFHGAHGGVGGAGAGSSWATSSSSGSTGSLSSSKYDADGWGQLHAVLFRTFQQSEWLEAPYNASAVYPTTPLHWGQQQPAALSFPPPPPPLPGLAVCLQPLAGPSGPSARLGTTTSSAATENERAVVYRDRASCGYGGGGCCSGVRREPQGWRVQLGLEGWGAVGRGSGEVAAAGVAGEAGVAGAGEVGQVGAGAEFGGEGAAGGDGAGRAAAALMAADDGLLQVVAATYAAHEAVLREVVEGGWPALVDGGG